MASDGLPMAPGHELIGQLREHYVRLRRDVGSEHPEVGKAAERFVDHCAGMATMYLEAGRGRLAWELLKWTEAAAVQNKRLLPTVYNGMACCLRKEGKHRSALNLLQQAASVAKTTGQTPAVCGNTYLNMCAVLSAVGKHTEALDAAKQALTWLRKGLNRLGAASDENPLPPSQRQARADLATMLAMALHNAAVQHEHLQQWRHALAAYYSASRCAANCLGTEHSISATLENAYTQASATIRAKTGVRWQPAMSAGMTQR